MTQEEAQELAQKLGLDYMETSAKTSHNVSAVFQKLAEDIVEASGY